jgi:hypothetical protein
MKEMFDSREKRPRLVKTIFILVVGALLAVTSCGRRTNTRIDQDAERKMKLVLGERVHQAKEPEHKAALDPGKVFVHRKGFDMAVVGAHVPHRFTGKRILVSFSHLPGNTFRKRKSLWHAKVWQI